MAARSGQRVLLTGASRGIGKAIARALVARGARLAVVGRDRATLAAAVADGGEHALLVADLTDPEAAPACVQRAVAALGGLDAFVSCAGVVKYASAADTAPDALAQQLTVNFSAPFAMARAAIEPLRSVSTAPALCDGAARGGGAMVFVASTLGLAPAPLTAAYSASKAALISACKSLALELAPDGIRVNAVAPGVVDTAMVHVLRPGGASAAEPEAALRAQLEALRKLHPLGRLGRPEDIAESVLYLLSAPFVTGTVLPVDGGLLLGSGTL
jgi:NAD(P)-dependent dehydrogenase (short-subunit alcohol dehydrogenase family)